MFGIGSTEIAVFAILLLFALGPKVPSWCANRNIPRGMRWGPRFALKDMFATTALIAVGMAWIFVALPDLGDSLDPLKLPMWSFVIGGAFIGAGVLAPLRMALVGSILGAIVQLLLVYTAFSLGWPTF